ncbi:MAG: HlyD family efflux transporter periplasmic adaptor subunit [bacterium]|nr:HlyD family efflux transporter periplasmic adaptor subunit [bacterium]
MRRALLLLLAALFLPLLAACSSPDAVPTYRVERRAFVHRVTAEGTLKAETTTPLTVPPEVRRSVRLAWLAPDGGVVKEGDVVARFDPTEMEERLEKGQADLRSAGLEVDKSKVDSGVRVASIDTKLKVADLELGHAQRFQKTDDQVFSRQDIVESQIDEKLAVDRKEHATDSRRTQESLSKTEVDLLAIKQRKAELDIEQARDGLSALEVRAPHGGILTLVRGWSGEIPQVGSQMWRGQQLAEIPDLTTMEAEVFVLEADAGGLEAGKPATVVIEASPEISYAAKIRRVDAVAKTHFRGSPVQYFGVVLELEDGADEAMKPGQRVRATLILDEVEDALVVPRQAVVQEGGQSRVFVRDGGELVARKVTTGPSSLGLVVVEDGLEEGELIALSPPASGGSGKGVEEAPADESGAPAVTASRQRRASTTAFRHTTAEPSP